MKYLFAKRPMTCKGCDSKILRGEFYIRNNARNKSTGVFYSFPYHLECYIKYVTDKIRKDAMFYMGIQEKPKKAGRPRKYSNPELAERLKALERYHRSAGNPERADEVKSIVDGLILTTG